MPGFLSFNRVNGLLLRCFYITPSRISKIYRGTQRFMRYVLGKDILITKLLDLVYVVDVLSTKLIVWHIRLFLRAIAGY